MNSNMPPEYVRTCRRVWALNQSELAFLLGAASRSQISRYERRMVTPPATAILALSCIFGEDVSTLFPHLYDEIEDIVMTRAGQLYQELQGKNGKAVTRKLDCLETMMGRAISRFKELEE
jgi:transcriptional regulator with XRE-family HTH domain